MNLNETDALRNVLQGWASKWSIRHTIKRRDCSIREIIVLREAIGKSLRSFESFVVSSTFVDHVQMFFRVSYKFDFD